MARPRHTGLVLVVAAALASCAGDDDVPTPDTGETGLPPECVDSTATWDGFTEGYVRTWCTPCHSENVPVEERRGAPPGVDFDTWEDTIQWLGPIAIYATGPDATMPPAGGVPDEDLALFEEWVTCGAPGPDEPDDPSACAEAQTAPPGTSAADLCAGGWGAIDGPWTIDVDADLSCLCRVSGDLTVTDAVSVDLPTLVEVTGDLRVSDTALTRLSAPQLATVGGDLHLERNPSLAHVDLRELDTIGGALLLLDDGLSDDEPDLREVDSVERLEIRGLSAAVSIELFRLATVGGDLLVVDNPGLVDLRNTSAVEHVDGDLRITGNPSLERVHDFATLDAVQGSVELGGNGAVTAIEGFDFLRTVGGDLILRDEFVAEHIDGFDRLETVGGTLQWSNLAVTEIHGFSTLQELGGLQIVDNPGLAGPVIIGSPTRITGDVELSRNLNLPHTAILAATEQIDGDLTIRFFTQLVSSPTLDALVEVGGTLRFVGSGNLRSLNAPALTTVGGSLEIEEHPLLEQIDGLLGLQTVGGDLVIRDNPSLPLAEINALVNTLGAGLQGQVDISGNGG